MCTYMAAGQAGQCTQTAGFLAEAEINQIITTNPTAQTLYDTPSGSNILVYNETQYLFPTYTLFI